MKKELFIKYCCDIFGTSIMKVSLLDRKRENVLARQLYYVINNHFHTGSLQEIANAFGQDHATVLHAVNTWDNLTSTNQMCNEASRTYYDIYTTAIRKYKVLQSIPDLSETIIKMRLMKIIKNNGFFDAGCKCYSIMIKYVDN